MTGRESVCFYIINVNVKKLNFKANVPNTVYKYLLISYAS